MKVQCRRKAKAPTEMRPFRLTSKTTLVLQECPISILIPHQARAKNPYPPSFLPFSKSQCGDLICDICLPPPPLNRLLWTLVLLEGLPEQIPPRVLIRWSQCSTSGVWRL